ncbi:recombinase family protein [Adhaeribacter soli]|uniref:Recombinase family protein n=1 Tax=Adhaeribacter soli TaxID=2607655 RepID=A0A5N1IX84_9BACT|nr:recombinase family protein [Adhaeribacter soli]KAA9338950.1 recombinase family protein [Adhaeribacter soli]
MQKKTAILVRVSTQDQSHSRQLTELTEYAEARGLQVVETITETISGSKSNNERKAIQQLLKLAKAKKINKVLIHEVTRLGRNTAELLATLEALHALKVSIVVKNYNLETLNPDGSVNSIAQFMFTLLADVGRMERATLIERVRSGMQEAKRKGKHVGRPQGTTKAKEDLLKQYKSIVKCLNEGQTVRNTATLTGKGVSTVMRVKKLLNAPEQA